MLEKWKEALDKGNFVDAVFMDLSKALDTLKHDLPIAKREAYGLSLNSLKYIRSYLNQHLQRTSVNNSLSLWKDITASLPRDKYLAYFYLIYILTTYFFSLIQRF